MTQHLFMSFDWNVKKQNISNSTLLNYELIRNTESYEQYFRTKSIKHRFVYVLHTRVLYNRYIAVLPSCRMFSTVIRVPLISPRDHPAFRPAVEPCRSCHAATWNQWTQMGLTKFALFTSTEILLINAPGYKQNHIVVFFWVQNMFRTWNRVQCNHSVKKLRSLTFKVYNIHNTRISYIYQYNFGFIQIFL